MAMAPMLPPYSQYDFNRQQARFVEKSRKRWKIEVDPHIEPDDHEKPAAKKRLDDDLLEDFAWVVLVAVITIVFYCVGVQ